MLSDTVDEVTRRPEVSAPQSFLYVWRFLEYLPCGDALHHAHDLGRAIRGYGLNEQMDMIPVSPDLDELDLKPLADLQAHVTQDAIHCFIDDNPAVLGGQDEMEEEDGYVVTLVDIPAHVPSVYQRQASRQAARNMTQEI